MVNNPLDKSLIEATFYYLNQHVSSMMGRVLAFARRNHDGNDNRHAAKPNV